MSEEKRFIDKILLENANLRARVNELVVEIDELQEDKIDLTNMNEEWENEINTKYPKAFVVKEIVAHKNWVRRDVFLLWKSLTTNTVDERLSAIREYKGGVTNQVFQNWKNLKLCKQITEFSLTENRNHTIEQPISHDADRENAER